MRKITSKELQEALQSIIAERLNVTAGKGKDKKVVIFAGLKIKHKTGLTYTIDSVEIENGKPIIHAHSGDGQSVAIGPAEFKNYERL